MVRYHVHITPLQLQLYTEWELRIDFGISIMIKSRYSDILEEFGISKTTLWRNLHSLFPPLKSTSLKYPWNFIAVGNSGRKKVRELIRFTKKKGRTTNLLRDKAAYILELAEMDGAHGLPRDTYSLTYEMKQFIHCVDKTNIANNITPKPVFKCARRVILG